MFDAWKLSPKLSFAFIERVSGSRHGVFLILSLYSYCNIDVRMCHCCVVCSSCRGALYVTICGSVNRLKT